MRITDCHLGFAGFGHMAQIIMQAIDATKLIPSSHTLFHRRDADKARHNEQALGITSTGLEHLISASDLILICVRPPQAKELLEKIAKIEASKTKMFLSIMAGVPLSALREALGPGPLIARAMPNIASSVGKGMTLLSFEPHVDFEFKGLLNILFAAIGKVELVAEEQMNVGCAMAGSGPAFVLELIEAMARSGVREGLDYEKALAIAAQTFSGAAELVLKGHKPENLLAQIATPKGTTVAGLEVFKREEISRRFAEVVQASSHRSKELS